MEVQAKLKLKVKVTFTQLPIGRENNPKPNDLPDAVSVSGSLTEEFSPQQEGKPNDQVIYLKVRFAVLKLHIKTVAAYKQPSKNHQADVEYKHFWCELKNISYYIFFFFYSF